MSAATRALRIAQGNQDILAAHLQARVQAVRNRLVKRPLHLDRPPFIERQVDKHAVRRPGNIEVVRIENKIAG